MAIITLTSDLGNKSHYPAIIKGVILSIIPSVTLVDVTHNVSSFDIVEAAYIVKHMYGAFPSGTVHIVAVDPDSHEQQQAIVVEHTGHVFVGPDNGILRLICDNGSGKGIYIPNDHNLIQVEHAHSFRAASTFAPIAAYLAGGGKLSKLGPFRDIRDLRWGEPSMSGNCLRGKIIYIDKFGNAVTNIKRDDFMELKNGRRFEIYIRNVRLRRIVNTYADVSKADALAIFGESKHLEIAMREASAAELLGLKINDMITIEFSK